MPYSESKTTCTPRCCKKINQVADDGVNLAQVVVDFWIQFPSIVRSMPLQIIIEVRQINQVQRRRKFIFNPFRGLGNPARGAIGLPCGESIPAAGPQKPKNGNSPKSFLISSRMEYGHE